jgi:hypothetical protein
MRWPAYSALFHQRFQRSSLPLHQSEAEAIFPIVGMKRFSFLSARLVCPAGWGGGLVRDELQSRGGAL